MTGAEVLELAAELIERDGWWDGSVEKASQHTNCILTAFLKIDQSLACTFETYEPIVEYLGLSNLPMASEEVQNWNDAPGRTSEQVCRMLRSVAAKMDGRYGPSDAPGSTETSLLDSAVISALVEHTEAPVASAVDRDYGDENWEQRTYEPAHSG